MPQKNTQDLLLAQDRYHLPQHHHSQWITWLWLVAVAVGLHHRVVLVVVVLVGY